MKIKILKRHFDRAVAQPWTPESCILAQAAGEAGAGLSGLQMSQRSEDADNIMTTFDRFYHESNREVEGVDVSDTGLAILRAALPITVDV